MPNLGDFIGHLMSEMTIARMQADVESIRIAEIYSSHPLLKSFPVPRFRLPNIEIDVPVVVKTLDETKLVGQTRGSPSHEELKARFKELLASLLQNESLKFDAKEKEKLDNIIDKKAKSLEKPKEVSVDTNRIADGYIECINSFFILPESKVDKKKAENVMNSLRSSLRAEFQNLKKDPSRLQVLLTTNEIREAQAANSVTQIHLKISEESYEWTTIESDGKTTDKLVVE